MLLCNSLPPRRIKPLTRNVMLFGCSWKRKTIFNIISFFPMQWWYVVVSKASVWYHIAVHQHVDGSFVQQEDVGIHFCRFLQHWRWICASPVAAAVAWPVYWEVNVDNSKVQRWIRIREHSDTSSRDSSNQRKVLIRVPGEEKSRLHTAKLRESYSSEAKILPVLSQVGIPAWSSWTAGATGLFVRGKQC